MTRIAVLFALVLAVSACAGEPAPAPKSDEPVPKSAEPAKIDSANKTKQERAAWRETRNPGWLVLTVKDVETGEPVMDADYHALKFAFDEARVEPQFSARISHTPAKGSATGRYRWKLAEGWHQIRIDATGYRNKWTPVFRIDRGQEATLEIEMRKSNLLKVILLDENGKPVEEGGVFLTGRDFRAGMHIENGVGERPVPVDEITVSLDPSHLEVYAPQSVTVPLKPGIQNVVTIRLKKN